MRYLSVFESDKDVLIAFRDIHNKKKWFDLDPTYSKGLFYDGLERPKYCSDLYPQHDFVIEASSSNLHFLEDGQIKSIVFDPPFLFRDRPSDNNNKIAKRFTYFRTYGELSDMYKGSLKEFNRVLSKYGRLYFKCQDMTDGKFYCTHKDVIDWAEEFGFELIDIAIKVAKNKLQRRAKQQNCVAKVHTYWLVFKKVA